MVDEATDSKPKTTTNETAANTVYQMLAGSGDVTDLEEVRRGADYAIYGCRINGVPSSLTWSVTP